MVETVMIFALGFLTAALLALLIIPAINARADRLARRRAEARFPLSISELTAEKDHLRAEFAVLQRRLERRAEEAQAVKHQSMEELGRRAIRIEGLETLLAERDQSIATLEADLAGTRSQLAGTTDELSSTNTILSGVREALSELEKNHRTTLEDLATTHTELDRTKITLSNTSAELTQAQEKFESLESAHADLDGRLTAAMSDLDAKRITISGLETRLMTQTARGDDFERALGERHTELSDERLRLAQLARDLASEQDRGLLLEERIRELETEVADKAAQAAALNRQLEEVHTERSVWQTSLEERSQASRLSEEALKQLQTRIAALEADDSRQSEAHANDLRSLSEKLETLRLDRAALEGALMTAREERARLEKEVQTLRKNSPESDEVRTENEDLRRRIVEVADLVMQKTSAQQVHVAATGKRRKSSRVK